jgi:hypothetical protein
VHLCLSVSFGGINFRVKLDLKKYGILRLNVRKIMDSRVAFFSGANDSRIFEMLCLKWSNSCGLRFPFELMNTSSVRPKLLSNELFHTQNRVVNKKI